MISMERTFLITDSFEDKQKLVSNRKDLHGSYQTPTTRLSKQYFPHWKPDDSDHYLVNDPSPKDSDDSNEITKDSDHSNNIAKDSDDLNDITKDSGDLHGSYQTPTTRLSKQYFPHWKPDDSDHYLVNDPSPKDSDDSNEITKDSDHSNNIAKDSDDLNDITKDSEHSNDTVEFELIN
eukprot:193332_1